MIYNARNRSDDATESQKKRPVLMLIFSAVSQKITGLNRMWSLKSLAMLKCESTCSTI